MQIITPKTLEALALALTSLPVGKSVYVTANDFKKLTGDDLTNFAAEGRFMIGNLSARTNLYRRDYGQARDFHQKPAPKLSLTYGLTKHSTFLERRDSPPNSELRTHEHLIQA